MKRKILFLSLALLLPVIIFLFLKKFGRNQFDIPVYHKDSVEFVVGCQRIFDAPYIIADSVIAKIGWQRKEATLICFSEMPSEGLMRLKEDFEPSQLQIVSFSDSLESARLKCVFLVSKRNNAVLIDRKKQIRGYYQFTTREEADRLLMEISILLKDY